MIIFKFLVVSINILGLFIVYNYVMMFLLGFYTNFFLIGP